jgi:hypothetical protein
MNGIPKPLAKSTRIARRFSAFEMYTDTALLDAIMYSR